MNILRAEAMGLCFGVRDAIEIARRQARPQQITILGQLVHNPIVSEQLSELGYRTTPEGSSKVALQSQVMITAHGISNRRRAELLQSGHDILDTTCPLVSRAHRAALALAREGRHVIVIGQPGHVEVRGLTEDLPSFSVVPSAGAAECYTHPKLGVLCQTTTTESCAQSVLARIGALNPHADIRFVDTICQPTKDRQRAMDLLIAACQAIVVVGGHNSNNTRKLVTACLDAGVPAFQVECDQELRFEWLVGVQTLGLTAGTSTLPETIESVYDVLKKMSETRELASMSASMSK